MNNAFAACHPVVNLVYFILVLVFALWFFHPLFLAVSFLCALWCAVALCGGKAVRRCACWLLPAALFAALINTAFNHAGATILAYFPSGNPLTLEALLYGFAAAILLCTAVLWFSCWNSVMHADKLMHLLGRVTPALSLLLAMTLRFVPRFQEKFHTVTAARSGMGLYGGSALQKLRGAAAVFSVMVTWSLENAIETADSMKSRGYGLPGRTAFSLYRMDRRDRRVLLWLIGCGALIALGQLGGHMNWHYYPAPGGALSAVTVCLLPLYAALCLTPVILQKKEVRAWNSTARKN